MNLTKINNYQIQVPDIPQVKKKWKGQNCLSVQYFVMAILGKRRSGKSTLIYTLLKNFITKNTICLFFVPTFYKDSTYDEIRKLLDEKGVLYQGYTSVEEDGVNNIEVFMKENTGLPDADPAGKAQDIEIPLEPPKVNFGPLQGRKKSSKPRKKIQPEYIIVFDDMSGQLREQNIAKLFKNSRHYRCKILASSQSITDFTPSQLAQTDYVALFKNYNSASIEQIYDRIQPNIDLEKFSELYNEVTSHKTHPKGQPQGKGLNDFLFIDRTNETFRTNLNKLINL